MVSGAGLGNTNFAAQFANESVHRLLQTEFVYRTKIDQDGLYKAYTAVAIPLCLGDSYQIQDSEVYYKCVGTTPEFFSQLVLDVDTEEKFKFADGRPFVTQSLAECADACCVGHDGHCDALQCGRQCSSLDCLS